MGAKLLDEETNQLDKEQLQQDLKMLENKVTDLLNEVKKCCSAASGCTETLSAIGRKASLEMLTYEDFKVALEEMEKKLEQHLTEISKKSILDILESERYLSTDNGTNYSNRKEDEIKDLVHSALLTYGADKTGTFDFALETAGGSVVSTRCTQMYTDRLPQYTWLGVPLWLPLNIWGPSTNPRTAIQPGVMPGECWAFKGSQGFLVIKLSMPMKPTRFSLEHIPKSLSPNGRIDSAPKVFQVFGLEIDKDSQPQELGRYTYDQAGEPLQFFPVENEVERPLALVELRILDNHGHDEYTCLYRFRVHGSL